MTIIVLIALFYGITILIRIQTQKKQRAEIDRVKAAQARADAEMQEQRRSAIAEELRIVELEQEQVRQRREQERLAKEQERQAEVLRRHEEEIAKLRHKLTSAESDIAHWSEQIGNLYALLDIEQANQASALPGSKTDIKAQKSIITLTNKIHAAEQRLSKAEFEKDSAQRKLEVA